MIGLAFYSLGYKTFFYPEQVVNGATMTGTQSAVAGESEESDTAVLKLDAEQIENIVNTEAFTHAVWPGYRGEITDGRAVRKHFSENLAKYIVNAGGVEVITEHVVHFYYIVRDDGGIQFLALVNDGRTTDDVPLYIIEHAQSLVNIGVPGIKPGTDVNGDPITVVYELVIRFKPNF